MIKVSLREKKLKNGRRSLYLDFYPPIIVDGKPSRREHLRLYIFEKPKTETERTENKETRILGENIRSQRQLELQANAYGFVSGQNRRKNFITYFKELCESKRKVSQTNYEFWHSILKHLEDFAGSSTTGMLIEMYPKEAKEKLRKLLTENGLREDYQPSRNHKKALL